MGKVRALSGPSVCLARTQALAFLPALFVILRDTCRACRYYSEAQALLYVVDAADLDRMEESRDVLRQLLSQPELADIPVLVFANKQDAPGAVTPHEVQARFGLQTGGTHAGSGPTHVLGVVSLSGQGVEEGASWLVDMLRSYPRALALSDSSASWDSVTTPV